MGLDPLEWIQTAQFVQRGAKLHSFRQLSGSPGSAPRYWVSVLEISTLTIGFAIINIDIALSMCV